MDAAFLLAKNIVDIRYDDIPPEAVQITKRDILDTLGTAVAGSTGAGSREVADLVKEWGGKEESTIIAYGGRVPAPNAALVNGTMPRSIDYEDTHDEGTVKAGSSVIPAAFAIAERRGGVTGTEFITAVTLGIDLICRMGMATKVSIMEGGWSLTALYGFFAAAATTGKILGLDEHKMVDALGIAYSQAAGGAQCVPDMAVSKGMVTGFAAKGGVLSALLAESGVTGTKNSLEGKHGLYNLYLRGRYDPVALTHELGKRFEVVNLGFKPYPSCRYSHAPIDATLALLQEHDVTPQDIEEIDVYVNENASTLCEPLEGKRNPQNIIDAQFSIPYIVATAVIKRGVTINAFTTAAINDPLVLQMAHRVRPKAIPELNARGIGSAIVEIRTSKGLYSKRVDFPKGHPNNPMTMDDIVHKFQDCVLFAARPLPQGNVKKVIQMVSELERVNDVSQIIRLLA